jgi:hypothetical protein
MPALVRTLAMTIALVACASSPGPEAAPGRDAIGAPDAGASSTRAETDAVATTTADAGTSAPLGPAGSTPASTASTAAAEAPTAKVKIVTIGMHVGGGPYDEPTKEPFKKAVEPHFPELAQCWAKHVPHPKQGDVGVDLLIEASGGHPKVSNPRSTLGKDPELEGFVPCVVSVFESVEFPKLARGRTGVSYSLRFTP